ncbi:hypothetical protein ECAE60S_03258 [Eoetvoesiella caeni]
MPYAKGQPRQPKRLALLAFFLAAFSDSHLAR